MQGSSILKVKPVTRAVIVALITSVLVCAGLLCPAPLPTVVDQLKLPADLAKYKEWRTLLKSPEPVPLEFWTRCVASTPAEWAQAREKHGPHTEHYIQVYANPIAAQTLRPGKASRFLTGAVIVKEKLMDSPQGAVAGVAFMIKRGTPEFASSGGWEFAYYPRSGDSASIQACVTCHRSAASKDYVFGQYPSPGDLLHPAQTHSR